MAEVLATPQITHCRAEGCLSSSSLLQPFIGSSHPRAFAHAVLGPEGSPTPTQSPPHPSALSSCFSILRSFLIITCPSHWPWACWYAMYTTSCKQREQASRLLLLLY